MSAPKVSTKLLCTAWAMAPGLWEDETRREVVVESLKADCEVRGEASGSLRDISVSLIEASV